MHTSDGPVPIERIRLGDAVVTLDADLDTVPVVAKVTGTVHAHAEETVTLDFGTDTIRCTPRHRFFTGSWTPAELLHPGTQVLRADGTWCELVSSARVIEPQPVFNLEVQHVHTYLVGDQGLLVHNIKVEEPFRQAPERNAAAAATRQRPFTPKPGGG